jgi:hypothetical protein
MSSAVLDNREKVAKINAELARLELEMEMDYGCTFKGDGFGYLGAGKLYDSVTNFFRRSGKTVKNPETDAQSLIFDSSILASIKTKWGVEFSKEAMLNQSWMDQFADHGGGVAFDAVHVWNADFRGRKFHVIFRASAKGRPEYSLVASIKAGKKNFADLLFTSSYVSAPADTQVVLDAFADRIAQCIVTRDDLFSIGQSAATPSAGSRRP